MRASVCACTVARSGRSGPGSRAWASMDMVKTNRNDLICFVSLSFTQLRGGDGDDDDDGRARGVVIFVVLGHLGNSG